ncbi:MAG: mRNA surveillance protein pelota [Thermoplasmatota archaeon]
MSISKKSVAMKILREASDRDGLRVRIDAEDDLYYLNQLVDPGTLVGSYTYRKLEAREDSIRADSQPRVRIYLRIEVEETEFHPFTDSLRIKGIIIDGPPEISGHHTINVDIGSELDIQRMEWSKRELALLEEAVERSRTAPVVAVSLDDETASIYRIRDYGLERVADVRVGAGGKMFKSEDRWAAYYTEIIDVLRPVVMGTTDILVTGPSFFKEELSKKVREELHVPASRIQILQASSGGLTGLKESISKGSGLNEALSKMRFFQESELVEELMARIGKGKGAAYGQEEVKKALMMGAAETLLIADSLFRTDAGRIMMDLAESTGCRVQMVSTAHEMGEMLSKLGEAAALLRFEI